MKAIEIAAHFYLEAIPGGDWNQEKARLCYKRPAQADAADEARTNIGRRGGAQFFVKQLAALCRLCFRPDFVTRSAA